MDRPVARRERRSRGMDLQDAARIRRGSPEAGWRQSVDLPELTMPRVEAEARTVLVAVRPQVREADANRHDERAYGGCARSLAHSIGAGGIYLHSTPEGVFTQRSPVAQGDRETAKPWTQPRM